MSSPDLHTGVFPAPWPRRAWTPRLNIRVAAAIALAVSAGALFLFTLTCTLPDTREILTLADNGRVTIIFDANDRPAFPVFKEERVEVPLSQISPNLIRAVLAVEDEHFYHHADFDCPRIVGAPIIREGYAGDLAAPIWARFMREATGNRKGAWLPQPADIVAIKVCRTSGLLPGPRCEPATEYFRKGTEPTQLCTVHAPIEIQGDAGGTLGDVLVGAGNARPPESVSPPPPLLSPPPRAIVPVPQPPVPGRTSLPGRGRGGSGDGRGF
jgi:membrane carboxypeptidase/penicillin-binding protein